MSARPAEPPPVPRRGRPTRAQALAALGLDVVYSRGAGSRLWHGPDDTPVWDFVGGYGATFFGHNHPALAAVVVDFLARGGVMHAQASVRSLAERLRAALDTRLRAAFGRPYQVVFGSTGAEAVEIAAKHADFAWSRQRDELAARVQPPATADGEPAWTDTARATLAGLGLWRGGDTLRAVAAHNRRVLDRPPVFLALRGGFHGMSSRALELTDDRDGRFGVRAADSRVRFIDPRSPGDLASALAERTERVVRIVARANGWHAETPAWTGVAGFFLEPIQGEGGIHPLDPEAARAWQAACRAHRVALIADEIQTGMGRTGSFLYCEQLGIDPDYVLLGKSLGGGLAKISAVAIAAEYHLGGFSLQHSSTFAEDDLSAGVALRGLELLDEEDALARAELIGGRLLIGLKALAARYPAVIAAVRGRGLMLGVEWRRQGFERSHALRFLQEHGWLGYALSAYLLRAHGLRVAPSLSSPTVIRLEPAYSLPCEAIERLLGGLDELCGLLQRHDSAALFAPFLGGTTEGGRTPHGSTVARENGRPPALRLRRVEGSHVAFVGHFIDAGGVGLWDRGLGRLGTDACRAFLERVRPLAEPLVCHREVVRAPSGATTTLTFIGIPVSSEQCHAALPEARQRCELRELVQRAVDLAFREGCAVVGLGGYCSILTRNGKDLRAHGMALTTGNGYTVGAGVLALQAAARAEGITLPDARAAVVGALGNIGSVLAELLAREVGSLVLVGRETRQRELEAAAGRLLAALVREAPGAPIARALAGLVAERHAPEEPGALFRRVRSTLGDRCPLDVAFSAHACREARLIATASNTPGAVVFPEHLGEEPGVLIDLAVPGDVHASVAGERPNVRVLRGGVIRTPCNPDWSVPGIPLAPGEMFACMTETVLMGLERETAHGSFGSLTAERVLATVEAARRHGFDAIRASGAVTYGPRPLAYSR